MLKLADAVHCAFSQLLYTMAEKETGHKGPKQSLNPKMPGISNARALDQLEAKYEDHKMSLFSP